jgi:hypothetical protein
MVRNPDYAELYALRQQLAEKLKAFDEAYGLESDFHVNTEEEHMETEPPQASPEPSAESPRMEAKSDPEGVETTPRWKNSSTWNDSTESTTYGDRDFSPPEFPPGADADEGDLYMREVRSVLFEKVSSGKTEAEAFEEAQNEIGEFEDWQKRRAAIFDSICDRLKGGGRDASTPA